MSSIQTTLPGYGKVHALGKPEVADLLNGDIVIQEKVDGSQFSFGIINGELQCRSKSVGIDLDAPAKLFSQAVEYVRSIQGLLVPGWVYRCEYLQRPSHNVLKYSRTPKNHLMLYDVQAHGESVEFLTETAAVLGIEECPELWRGRGAEFKREMLDEFLKQTSVLGGALVEGVVIKRRNAVGPDGSMLKGKYVSEAFKETHKQVWKEISPGAGDIIELLTAEFRTPVRWDKAVQHLRDAGTLTDSPKDIGELIKEVRKDVQEECVEEIKQRLWKWAWPKLERQLAWGLPEWYKSKLADKQFGEISNETTIDNRDIGDEQVG